MNFEKARAMAEMAEIYDVSEEDFRYQLENHVTLMKALQRLHYKGKFFFPKHQVTVVKFLGLPGDSARDVMECRYL